MPRRLTTRSTSLIAAVTCSALAAPALATDTHAEYVAQVNPICKDAARQAKKIPGEITPSGDPYIDALQRTRLFGGLLHRTIARIAPIGPAPGEGAAVGAWLDEGRHQVRLIHGLLRAVRHGNAQRAKLLTKRITKSQQRGQALAAALGLTACAGKRSD